jgi:hypothetical protein
MLKLKSASEHYEETKTNLQKMCESIDKISQTHQKLSENMSLAIAEMEKTNLENEKTQEFIQSLYDEAKRVFDAEAQRHEASVKASLTEKFNEISDEVRKQTDKILQDNANQSKVFSQINEEFGKKIEKIHQDNANQSKSMRLLKALVIVGIVLEAVIIIRMFLF